MTKKEEEIKEKILSEYREFTKRLEGMLREIENTQSKSSSNIEKERLHKRYVEVVEMINFINSKARIMFREPIMLIIKSDK